MRYFYLLLVSTCTHYAIYGILLKVSEPLSWEERFSVLKDTCNGLVYLHDGRMVHQDIKRYTIPAFLINCLIILCSYSNRLLVQTF